MKQKIAIIGGGLFGMTTYIKLKKKVLIVVFLKKKEIYFLALQQII